MRLQKLYTHLLRDDSAQIDSNGLLRIVVGHRANHNIRVSRWGRDAMETGSGEEYTWAAGIGACGKHSSILVKR